MGEIKDNRISHTNNGQEEELTQNGLGNINLPVNIHLTVLFSVGGAITACAILFCLCYFLARRNARNRRLRHALQNADVLGQQGFADAADRLRATARLTAHHSEANRLSRLFGIQGIPEAAPCGPGEANDREAAARAYTMFRCMQDFQKEGK